MDEQWGQRRGRVVKEGEREDAKEADGVEDKDNEKIVSQNSGTSAIRKTGASAFGALLVSPPCHCNLLSPCDSACTTTCHRFRRLPRLCIEHEHCLLYTSPSPRDLSTSRMPSSA